MDSEKIELPFFTVIEKGVQYGEADGKPLLLDLAYPTETPGMPAPEKMPAVIDVHGGGWTLGERDIGRGLMLPLNGFFYASIDYRLSQEAKFPAQIHDVKAAIRWLRAHADHYNVDPDRIGLRGGSAGGHLISLAGVTGDQPELEGDCGWPGYSTVVQAIAAENPVTDFRVSAQEYPWLHEPGNYVEQLFGKSIADCPDLLQIASPMAYDMRGAPPIMLLHGTDDTDVVFSQSEKFYNALVEAGVPATLVAFEGGDHVLMGYSVQRWEHSMRFFKKHLGQAVNYGDPSLVSVRSSE